MSKPNRDTIHNIYVKVVTGSDNDYRSRDITLNILKYLQLKMPLLIQMGVDVKINKIRSQDLQNPRLIEAIRQKGIVRLPALITTNNVYIGFKDIIDVYENNIKIFMSMNTQKKKSIPPQVKKVVFADDLDEYYKSEMTLAKANKDTEEEDFGEGADMMNSYRNRMENRDTSSSSILRKTTVVKADSPKQISDDNIDVNEDDAEIQETINRLAQDIDNTTRERAFTATDGDEDGPSPQDDLMERAYWGGRISSSDNL